MQCSDMFIIIRKIIKDVLRNLNIEIEYKPSEILYVMNCLGYIW